MIFNANFVGFCLLLVLSLAFHWNVLADKSECNGSVPVSEFNALSSFYFATNGPDWRRKWNISQGVAGPCSNWTGVMCTNISDGCHVTTIHMIFNRLRGTLPEVFTDLPHLKNLSLPVNRLHGDLPTSIATLSELEVLFIGYNRFVGTIPESYYSMPQLEVFDLAYNKLTGVLPSAFHMPNLLQFIVYNNDLGGTLVEALSQLRSLTSLMIYGNEFYGTIPTSIFELRNITTFDVNFNQLSGTIPPEITKLTAVLFLNIDYNSLTGTLPSIISVMTSMQAFAVNNNLLEGTLPLAYTKLSQLTSLYFGGNLFTGTVPAQYSSLKLLEFLFINSNSLTGPMTFLNNLDALIDLSIQNNHFHGSIPQVWSTLDSLYYLYAYGNHFSGNLPISLTHCKNLTFLTLQDNYLTGSVPSEYYTMSKLVYLNLSTNYLSGPLESSITVNGPSLKTLQYIDFSFNAFSGTIPSAVWKKLPGIFLFSLSENCLHGTLPSELCSLNNMTTILFDNLALSSKCASVYPDWKETKRSRERPGVEKNYMSPLYGTIPSCMVLEYVHLRTLQLSGNGFTGSLPPLPCNTLLLQVSLMSNLLTGTLPLSWQYYGNFTSLMLSFNRIGGTLATDFNVKFNNITNNDRFLSTCEQTPYIRTYQKRAPAILNGYIQHFFANHSFYVKFLNLSSNRFSGDIPTSFSVLDNMDVIQGNVFACANPPSNDINSNTYNCGSNILAFNAYYYVGTFFLMLIAFFMCFGCLTFKDNEFTSGTPIVRGIKAVLAEIQQTITESKKISILSFYVRHILDFFSLLIFAIIMLFAIFILRAVTDFSTLSVQYWYATTFAFCHGPWPAALIAFIQIVVVLHLVNVGFNSIQSAGDPNVDKNDASFYSIRRHGSVDRKSSKIDNLRLNSLDINGNDTITPTMKVEGSEKNKEEGTNDEAIETKEEEGEESNEMFSRSWWRVFALQSTHLIMVSGLNIVYILLVSQSSSTTLRTVFPLIVGILKDTWSQYYVPFMIDIIAEIYPAQIFIHEFWATSLSFFIAPFVVTLMTDVNCFYFAITTPASFDISYVAPEYSPRIEVHNNTVSIRGLQTSKLVSTELDRPWLYTFTCGSALIVDYVPVVLSAYMVSLLVNPVVTVMMLYQPMATRKRLVKLLGGVLADQLDYCFSVSMDTSPLDDIALTHEERKERFFEQFKERQDIRSSEVINSLLAHIIMMSTFGLFSPPLFAVIYFTMVLEYWTKCLQITKYLQDMKEMGHEAIAIESLQHVFVKYENLEFLYIPYIPFIVFIILMYWAILFYDFLADETGTVIGLILLVSEIVVLSFITVYLYNFPNIAMRIFNKLFNCFHSENALVNFLSFTCAKITNSTRMSLGASQTLDEVRQSQIRASNIQNNNNNTNNNAVVTNPLTIEMHSMKT